MTWAWWMIGIFLLLQIVLLAYLLVSKARSIRYEAKLDTLFDELLPEVIAYSAEESAALPDLPKDRKLRKEVLELLLSRLSTITQESREQERLHQLAVEELQPLYKKMLLKGSWSARMNALYFIEDFALQEMQDDIYLHVRRLSEEQDEFRQAMRTLATLSDPRTVELIMNCNRISLTFIKEILRRFDEDQLHELKTALDASEESNELLLQAFLVHVGERHLINFLEDVEQALESDSKEIRLKAMKSIIFYQFMMHPEKIKVFMTSPYWEERMYACKVTAALSKETWREELMELLGDQEWWVRFAAAEALNTFSDGMIILEYAKNNHKDRYGRDMAAQMLTTFTEVNK
ncbi:HEAT repeat domain-containing protein [Alkalicoccus daliensis]|uniref:HEAT repeat-containing protein n=1 Tax=Alkalicoccus daliensis TaxID=745820 RepID=A0A1H0K763_9BACI|nr:HEAT repeat domain-containing protein [Alkalicoccus daliensis]SDO51590.1 HEAT repeat-containing protein [Alkalicoccus daliensis]